MGKNMGRKERRFLLLGLALTVALSASGPPTASAARNQEGRRTPIVRAVERAAPAVVNVSTLQIHREANPFSKYRSPLVDEFFRESFSRPRKSRKPSSLGSGVIIRPEGFILTNEHVISRASKIQVVLADGRSFPARLIGSDPANDLAVIKIDAKEPLPHLPMGRSNDLMIGETVIAIGNPFGLSHTVTTGVVSALGRSLDENGRRPERRPSDFIQTDASINPGNSGGPLMNLYGDLIGINTAIFSNAQGIGFAIPIDRAHRIVNDLILFGKVRKGWAGLILQDINTRIAKYLGYSEERGAVTVKVFKGSPAERTGIRRGDVLLSFGEKDISSRDDFLNELAGYTVGSRLEIRIWRQGKVLEREITLGGVPEKLSDKIAEEWLGIRVASINEKAMSTYRLMTRQGVLVTEIIEGAAAQNIGIRPGDVVRQINGVNTNDISSFRHALVRARDFPRVQLLVQRRRTGYNVTLKP